MCIDFNNNNIVFQGHEGGAAKKHRFRNIINKNRGYLAQT